MKIPLLALILQGIPETIAVVTLAFVLARISLDWRKIISFAIILTFTAYFVRLLPITFGIHTIILMGMLFIFLTYFSQAPLLSSIKACLVSYLTLIIVEYLCFTSLTTLFDISFEMYLNNITLRIILGLPQVLLLFIIAFTIFKVRQKGKKSEHF